LIPISGDEELISTDSPSIQGIEWRQVTDPKLLSNDDLAARAALIEQATGEHYDIRTLRLLPYETRTCSFELIAGEQHPVGLLWTALINEYRARVLVFVIASGYQDRGLGSHAWDMMLADLHATGINLIQLEVNTLDHGALRLYRRLSLKQIGVIREYYTRSDGILMEWSAPTGRPINPLPL